MKEAIQLFGYLILAILGVVAPIMAILLSVFQEGISKLTSQSEADKSQSESNLRRQLKKLAEAKDTDESAILQSVKELKSIKKTAETQLSYLSPRNVAIKLFVPLIIAFLGVVMALLLVETNILYLLFLLPSVIGFTYTVFVLSRLIRIIAEVRRIIDAGRKEEDSVTKKLLATLVERDAEAGSYFLKKVYTTLDGSDIKDNSRTITINANNKRELKIGIQNHENRMAKNVEIGFVFPTNFIIEKTGKYSIFRDEESQVVRYAIDMVHAKTDFLVNVPITVTPLEKGNYLISNFVKAENVESVYRDVTIKVT